MRETLVRWNLPPPGRDAETVVRLGLHVRKVTVRGNTTERVLRSANWAPLAVPAPSLDPGRGPRFA